MSKVRKVSGEICYPSGALYFEGTYDPTEWNNLEPWKPNLLFEGTVYYENGAKYREGLFQRGGLLEGSEFYQSGQLKFHGKFNNKEKDYEEKGTSYYGPSYPVEGDYFSEDGTLIFSGKFHVVHQGGVGYPRVVSPEGYGSLR